MTMDAAGFNASLPSFNTLLLNSLSGPQLAIENNYVRSQHNQRYSYTRLRSGARTVDFTVCYDAFYMVPVLHFRHNDSVEFEDSRCVVDMHPLLHLPFVLLHPCETRAVMESVGGEGVEYLVRWFGLHFSGIFPEIQLRPRHT